MLGKPFRYRFFYATFYLLAANALVFFATLLYPGLKYYLGMSLGGILGYHFWWQPLTYMFVHSGWSHFIFNMLALVMFGLAVERTIGSLEFLVYYFVCGILDGIISLLLYFFSGTNTLLVGASGAIYAVLLAFAVLYPRSILRIWGIVPVPAPLLVILYAVIELVSHFAGGGSVAHLAHLVGFALGGLYFVIRMGVHPARVWRDAWRR